MNEHLRQRGRTSRMLAEATSRAAQGYDVLILVHDLRYAKMVRQHPYLKHVPTIHVDVVPEDLNWHTLQLETRPHVFVLVDHYAVELHLAKVDEQILRLQQLARQLYHLTT